MSGPYKPPSSFSSMGSTRIHMKSKPQIEPVPPLQSDLAAAAPRWPARLTPVHQTADNFRNSRDFDSKFWESKIKTCIYPEMQKKINFFDFTR